MSATLSNESQTPTCQNCATSTTPLWRRDEIGSVLCNACGLFLKLHGRPRPISLKTDVIKSRNRVKSSGASQQMKKKVSTSFIRVGVGTRQALTPYCRASSTPMATASTRPDRKEEHPRQDIWDRGEHLGNLPMVILMDQILLYLELRPPRCTVICFPLRFRGTWTITTITIRRLYLQCITFVNRLPDALLHL